VKRGEEGGPFQLVCRFYKQPWGKEDGQEQAALAIGKGKVPISKLFLRKSLEWSCLYSLGDKRKKGKVRSVLRPKTGGREKKENLSNVDSREARP